MKRRRWGICLCWNISAHAQKQDCKHMEDVTNLRFTNQSLCSEADRATDGFGIWHHKKELFKTEAPTYFWMSNYKDIHTTVTVLHDKRFYMIEFNLLDERKLEKSSVHCELKMFLFVLFVLGTTKSGISCVIFQFRLFPTKSVLCNKLCCMRVMTKLWILWILLQFLIAFSSLVLSPFSVMVAIISL